jgi:hypothetical protein
MVKIKIEGKGAKLAGKLAAKLLREQGLEVNFWFDVTPSGVAAARRDAARESADVSIVAMRR